MFLENPEFDLSINLNAHLDVIGEITKLLAVKGVSKIV